MSQSPSYQRDTASASASASPESPEEGDFAPRQLYDKPNSLEEHETHGGGGGQKDPIVNILPDSYSGFLLNAPICALLATNDLGKLCTGMLPREQPIKESELVGLNMKKTRVRSQAVVYILYIIIHFSPPI